MKKNMKIKKVIALFLTLTMILSMTAVTSFAAEGTSALEGTKTAELTDRDGNEYKVTVQVPGGDGVKQHDEVIVMVDGSYSMDSEWESMKAGIMEIGNTVLDGTGNTQLTLMTFGISYNIVAKHIKSVSELKAALPSKPGGLLYGRSATNCAAGFEGAQNYIQSHDATLKNAYVIYMTDGGVNMNSSKADWIKVADNVTAAYAEACFTDSVAYMYSGKLKPSAVTKKVFGDDIERIIELYPYYKEYASKKAAAVDAERAKLAENQTKLETLKAELEAAEAKLEVLNTDQDRIEAIYAEIAEHEAEIEKLDAEKAALDNTEKIAEIDAEIEEHEDKIAELEAEIENLTAAETPDEAAIAEAKADIQERQEEIVKLEAQLTELNTAEKIAQLAAEIQEHQDQIDILNAELAGMATAEELEQLKALTEEIAALKTQIADLETEIAPVQEGLQNFDEFCEYINADAGNGKTKAQQWVLEAYKAFYKEAGLDEQELYPIYVAETAYVAYEKKYDSDFYNLFYYLIGQANVMSNNGVAASNAGNAAASSMDALYLVRYDDDSRAGWMKNVTGSNVTYMESGAISNLTATLQVLLQDLAKLPYNDVSVTDYMSKWVDLKPETIKVYDKDNNVVAEFDEANSDVENGNYVYKWTSEALCADKAPIVLELVSPDGYAAGGPDVEGNVSGDIYKITWNIKDGPLYRADNYRMEYQVTVDVEEENFQYNTTYPANGTTTVDYTDENGDEQVNDIEVPTVDVPKDELPEDQYLEDDPTTDTTDTTNETDTTIEDDGKGDLPEDQYLQDGAADSDVSAEESKDSAAQTGDDTPMGMLFGIVAAAAAVMAVSRRRTNE